MWKRAALLAALATFVLVQPAPAQFFLGEPGDPPPEATVSGLPTCDESAVGTTREITDEDDGVMPIAGGGTTHVYAACGWTSGAYGWIIVGSGSGSVAAGDITGTDAGTDLTADLEEESHRSEHESGGGDVVRNVPSAGDLDANEDGNPEVLPVPGASVSIDVDSDGASDRTIDLNIDSPNDLVPKSYHDANTSALAESGVSGGAMSLATVSWVRDVGRPPFPDGAPVFYVSSSSGGWYAEGDDANSGTQEAPLHSLDHAGEIASSYQGTVAPVFLLDPGDTWGENEDCTGSGTPFDYCTASGTGTGGLNVTNATCTASGVPHKCCTGSGTGTCSSQYGFNGVNRSYYVMTADPKGNDWPKIVTLGEQKATGESGGFFSHSPATDVGWRVLWGLDLSEVEDRPAVQTVDQGKTIIGRSRLLARHNATNNDDGDGTPGEGSTEAHCLVGKGDSQTVAIALEAGSLDDGAAGGRDCLAFVGNAGAAPKAVFFASELLATEDTDRNNNAQDARCTRGCQLWLVGSRIGPNAAEVDSTDRFAFLMDDTEAGSELVSVATDWHGYDDSAGSSFIQAGNTAADVYSLVSYRSTYVEAGNTFGLDNLNSSDAITLSSTCDLYEVGTRLLFLGDAAALSSQSFANGGYDEDDSGQWMRIGGTSHGTCSAAEAVLPGIFDTCSVSGPSYEAGGTGVDSTFLADLPSALCTDADCADTCTTAFSRNLPFTIPDLLGAGGSISSVSIDAGGNIGAH